jgi:hypothetical protein
MKEAVARFAEELLPFWTASRRQLPVSDHSIAPESRTNIRGIVVLRAVNS